MIQNLKNVLNKQKNKCTRCIVINERIFIILVFLCSFSGSIYLGKKYLPKNNAKVTLVKIKAQKINQSIRIKIPRIKIALPVYQKSTKYNLAKGAIQANPHFYPGIQNNYVIYAHNLVYSNKLFTNLKNIKLNDVIILASQHKQYIYHVIFAKNVKIKQQSKLLARSKTPIITLYTCLDNNDQTQRFIVRAKLIRIVD